MLLIDNRIGSKDLLSPLQRAGVPCELQHLEFADFAFLGRGPKGADIYIGVELKETGDLIASLQSARFSGHQLPGLQSAYDRVWLLTEGIWRASEDGVLEELRGGWRSFSHGRRRIMAADLDAWILSQVIRGGVNHWHTGTRRDTIRFLATLYTWWTHKSFEEHRSHEAIYLPPPDRAMLTEPSTFLKMVSCLPRVGWDKARKLEAFCIAQCLALGWGEDKALDVLMRVTARELQTIDGIGPTVSTTIVQTLHGKM